MLCLPIPKTRKITLSILEGPADNRSNRAGPTLTRPCTSGFLDFGLELLWQELPWDSCVVYLPMLIELRECVGLVTISGVITPPYHSTYLH